jgi:UDP-N-acetylmuramate dehydrogenase
MNIPSFLIRDKDITNLSGYHTHTIATYFFELRSEDDLYKLHEIYLFAQGNHLDFLVIWGGTNLLFANERFEWVIVKNSLQGWEYDPTKKLLHASSNESIWEIAENLERGHNNALWHRFIGLPGSIGGAVFWNAGCFGLETESNFHLATVYDMQLWVRRVIKWEEMQFSYRHSLLKDNPELFLVGACFDLSEKREKYHSDVDNIYFREYKQPKWYCCGSFFKNPSKETSAGFLIESVWLKWYHHGGAYWSDLHANFLMSDGVSCTGQDLVGLIQLTQEKVLETHWINLVNEVRIIH